MGTGFTLFSNRLFWRQLKFGGNWLHIIFQKIVLEVAQIWRELAPHYFPTDCFGGSSNLEGTGSTLFSDRLFWRQLKFGGNWLHIIFRRIVFEIWRELALHYFPADCFGFSHTACWFLIPPAYLEVSIGDTQEHPLGVYLEIESLYFNIH